MTAPPGKSQEHCNTEGANSHGSANRVIEGSNSPGGSVHPEAHSNRRYSYLTSHREEDKERVADRPVGLASACLPFVTFLQLFLQ